jgi:hypothetical protein
MLQLNLKLFASPMFSDEPENSAPSALEIIWREGTEQDVVVGPVICYRRKLKAKSRSVQGWASFISRSIAFPQLSQEDIPFQVV